MTRRPEEIENSRARAEDRGRPDGFTFFATETPEEDRYLGDPSDVAEIVREFGMAVHAIRSDAGNDKITGDEALKRLNELAERYARIFYGQEPGFRVMAFNSPEALGASINAQLGMDGPEEAAAKTLFMATANDLLAAYEGHQSGGLSDQDVQFQIEAAIENASRMLLGLPLEE
jgi:hypothetical protein